MRCISCGSKNISMINKNEGYSYAKGIAGQLVFGPIGAVAGINGKSSQIYHCNACGKEDIICMAPEIEALINDAIETKDYSTINYYKRQYPNIEETSSGRIGCASESQ